MQRRALIITGIVALGLVLLAAAALAVLPRLAVSQLSAALTRDFGLTLSDGASASLSLEDGLSVEIAGAAIASPQDQGVPLVSGGVISAPLSLSGLFGSGGAVKLNIADAVVTLNIGEAGEAPKRADAAGVNQMALGFRNVSLKVNHPARGAVVAATDVSGEALIDAQGALLVDARGLLNGRRTQMTASFDAAGRLLASGSPSDIALTAGDDSLLFSGRAILGRTPKFDGTATLSGPDTDKTLAWLGLPAIGVADLSSLLFEGPVSSDGLKISFSKAQIMVGESSGEGRLEIDARLPRPKLAADLRLSRLAFGLPRERPALTDSSVPWSERGYDLAALKTFDGTVEIAAKSVDVMGFSPGAAQLSLQAENGSFILRLSPSDPAGERWKGRISGALADDVPAGRLDFFAESVAAAKVLPKLFGVPAQSGTALVVVRVEGTGANDAALVSSLKGSARIEVSKSVIPGVDAVARLKSPGQGWAGASPGATDLGFVRLTFDLADGVATLNPAEVTLPSASFTVSGTFDLLRKAVAFDVKSEPPVKIEGPVDNPRFGAKP